MMALAQVGVPLEILTFSTRRDCTISRNNRHCRQSTLLIEIVKTFHESLQQGLRRHVETYDGTPLGEGIKLAADRLMARPEKRKILLVMTDGATGNGSKEQHTQDIQQQYLVDVVKEVGRKVELIGVAFLSTPAYLEQCGFQRCVHLRTEQELVDKLGQELMQQLSRAIVRKMV